MDEIATRSVAALREAVASRKRGTRSRRPGKLKGTFHETGSLTPVDPADVVSACDAVPEAARSATVRDLRAGSAKVLEHKLLAGDPRTLEVLVEADDLHHLLDLVPKE